MSTGQTVFRKLMPAEKNDLIEEIQSQGLPIFFKFEKTFVFRARVLIGQSKESFFLNRPESLHKVFDGQLATVICPVDGERYFFSTIIRFEGDGKVRIDFQADVFRLQRRKHKRVNIPETYPAFFVIKKMDGQMGSFKCRIFDISEGGMRVGLSTDLPEISVGQIIQGTLSLEEKKGVEIRTYVRHVRKSSDSLYKQMIGIEFQDISPYTKALVANQILDLQRDLFNLFSEKK